MSTKSTHRAALLSNMCSNNVQFCAKSTAFWKEFLRTSMLHPVSLSLLLSLSLSLSRLPCFERAASMQMRQRRLSDRSRMLKMPEILARRRRRESRRSQGYHIAHFNLLELHNIVCTYSSRLAVQLFLVAQSTICIPEPHGLGHQQS